MPILNVDNILGFALKQVTQEAGSGFAGGPSLLRVFGTRLHFRALTAPTMHGGFKDVPKTVSVDICRRLCKRL